MSEVQRVVRVTVNTYYRENNLGKFHLLYKFTKGFNMLLFKLLALFTSIFCVNTQDARRLNYDTAVRSCYIMQSPTIFAAVTRFIHGWVVYAPLEIDPVINRADVLWYRLLRPNSRAAKGKSAKLCKHEDGLTRIKLLDKMRGSIKCVGKW